MKKKIKTFIFVLFIILIVLFILNRIPKNEFNKVENIHSEKINQSFFLYPKLSNNQVIENKIYTLSYSEKDEQAEWVAYKLFQNSINLSVKRKDNFRKDLRVITGSATLNDYKKSGFDRGHLAPAKTMSYSKETMSESFYMSNMSPQKPSFNRGIWKKLEEKVRSWIPISDSLYVVTGPVLDNPLGAIGENNVTVPSAYYKTIVRFKKDKIFGIGFLLKNEKSNQELRSFSVSIDSIEKVTGLDFFYNLDSVVQNSIESNSDYERFLQ